MELVRFESPFHDSSEPMYVAPAFVHALAPGDPRPFVVEGDVTDIYVGAKCALTVRGTVEETKARLDAGALPARGKVA